MSTANEAYQQAAAGNHVIGWRVDPAQRAELVARFPPRYTETVADHVTLKAKVAADSSLPGESRGEIVGEADDGQGVQALVVAIGGTTDRPGGGTYHITWSLAPGRGAKESNDIIGSFGWQRLETPVAVRLVPARFPSPTAGLEQEGG
jgi:hypothetical protein